METENPTDPENSKWVVAYIMVFRPAFSLPKPTRTYHVFGTSRKTKTEESQLMTVLSASSI